MPMPVRGDGARSRSVAVAPAWAAAALAVLLPACTTAPVSGPAGPLVFETVTEDGVEVARNVSGSVWDAPRRLVEQVAIGDSEADDPAFMLGMVAAVAATDDRVYALDISIPTVRVYGMDGEHLLDMGRGGQGPGEFESPNGMTVDADGRVLVSDTGRHVVQIYAPDGTHVDTWSWRHGGSIFASRMLFPSAGGGAWVGTFVISEGGDFADNRIGYLHLTAQEQGEPTLRPEIPGFTPLAVEVSTDHGPESYDWVVPFAPVARWAMDSDGNWYVGSGETYRIHVLGADGSSHRVIERYPTPVEVLPAEAEAHLRRAEADVRQMSRMPEWRWDGPPVPTTKRAFSGLLPDRDGRLWVLRPGPGRPIPGCDLEAALAERGTEPCWTQEFTLDAFDAEGRYLGGVAAPAGTTARLFNDAFIAGDRVVMALPDELGNPQVVVYRLETPGEEAGAGNR